MIRLTTKCTSVHLDNKRSREIEKKIRKFSNFPTKRHCERVDRSNSSARYSFIRAIAKIATGSHSLFDLFFAFFTMSFFRQTKLVYFQFESSICMLEVCNASSCHRPRCAAEWLLSAMLFPPLSPEITLKLISPLLGSYAIPLRYS